MKKRLFIIKHIDIKLLISTIILFSIGLVMIYSSSNITAFVINDASPARYFLRQLFFLSLSFLASYIFITLPSKKYYRLSILGVVFSIFAILASILYGAIMNGAQAWIKLPIIGTFQPSEFAKIFIIPMYAGYYETNKKYKDDTLRMLVPLALSAIIAVLIVLQNDFGTAIIFTILSLSLFFISPASKKLKRMIFMICLVGLTLISLMVMTFGNKIIDQDKIDRFNFFNPCERYLNTGNQLCNGYIAINNGGLFGKGLGNSTQKYLYLPESHTDFIFAIFIEELGLLGGVVLISIYLYTLYRIFNSLKASTSINSKIICYGVIVYLVLHITINLGGVLGLIPVTGIPLAFLSYGGTYCISVTAGLAMVQRINFENKTTK